MNELNDFIDGFAGYVATGHQKRDNAFLRQIQQLCSKPSGTACGKSSSMADVVSAYRFAVNPDILLKDIRKSRLQATIDSLDDDDTLIMINDVSELNYYTHESKKDRRSIGDGKGKGYEYVCNLGIAMKDETIRGVLHDCVISKDGPDDADVVNYHSNPMFNQLSKTEPQRLECNHKHQLVSHFTHVNRYASDRRIILTADREFDDHILFDTVIAAGQNCVIRSNALRNVQIKKCDWIPQEATTTKLQGLRQLDEHVCVDMRRLIPHVPLAPYARVPLDSKGRHTESASAKSWADLSAGAFTVVLYRCFKRNKRYFSPKSYVTLNVVVVRETAKPLGRDPICWVLYTTLPIDTQEQIAMVVRIYELRWKIECFFKFLKSGYKLEALRHNSAQRIARHLVVITIASVFLLNLKKAIGLPNASVLDIESYKKIKVAEKELDNTAIALELRMFAFIAKIGGWRGRRNDPIGPLVLMRGFAQLMEMIELSSCAQALLQELTHANMERK